MKKILLTLTVVASTVLAFGQVTTPNTTEKEYKNVIGIDATGLLQQFFNFNSTYYFNSPYMVSYKRICESNAFRIGIGGNSFNDNGTTNDTLADTRIYNYFNAGIGYEHYSYLGERWNVYFGADAIVNYRYNDYRSSYTASTSYRQSSTDFGYGISPLLGLQFKIHPRFSIATETSYDIIYATSKSSTINTPSSVHDKQSKNTGIQTRFNAPKAINFRILF